MNNNRNDCMNGNSMSANLLILGKYGHGCYSEKQIEPLHDSIKCARLLVLTLVSKVRILNLVSFHQQSFITPINIAKISHKRF